MRGSDPDAAIYWMMRMLEAGDDPLFVLRRLIIFASEDIGNADPRRCAGGDAADAGLPPAGHARGHVPDRAVLPLYLACAPKSNAVKNALDGRARAVRQHGALPVPSKLRNAPTP